MKIDWNFLNFPPFFYMPHRIVDWGFIISKLGLPLQRRVESLIDFSTP